MEGNHYCPGFCNSLEKDSYLGVDKDLVHSRAAKIHRRRCHSEGLDRSPYEDARWERIAYAYPQDSFKTQANKSQFTINNSAYMKEKIVNISAFPTLNGVNTTTNGLSVKPVRDLFLSSDYRDWHRKSGSTNNTRPTSPPKFHIEHNNLPKVEELIEKMDHDMMEFVKTEMKQPLKSIHNNPIQKKSPPQSIVKKIRKSDDYKPEAKRRQRALSESEQVSCRHASSILDRQRSPPSSTKKMKDNSEHYPGLMRELGPAPAPSLGPQQACRVCRLQPRTEVPKELGLVSVGNAGALTVKHVVDSHPTRGAIPVTPFPSSASRPGRAGGERPDRPAPERPDRPAHEQDAKPCGSITPTLPLNKSRPAKKKVKKKMVKKKRPDGGDMGGGGEDTAGAAESAKPAQNGLVKSPMPAHAQVNGAPAPLVSNGVLDSHHNTGSPIELPANLEACIRKSLFPHVPPYMRFVSHDKMSITPPVQVAKHLKWKLTSITPIIVKKTLINSGFKLVRSDCDTSLCPQEETIEWIGIWGKHMKSLMFRAIKENQKMNHFPGTFQIGRKDRLWRNLQKLVAKFGVKEFGIMPRTYVLPYDLKLLRHDWDKYAARNEKWIIKPPASARGTGIKVVSRWTQIPKKRSVVVQRYVARPYLINGSKFDIRLYVLVTSIHPLRVYLYKEGLARFASVKYNDEVSTLHDRYMHLTNYSINRLSKNYTANEDADACQGHKWTLKSLFHYMEERGVDTVALWNRMRDLVIKTIIAGEASISALTKANVTSRYNCYELFGVDVLLDEHLKPWLLEVNISPSLHSASPLDMHVKGPLVVSTLNMAQYHIPERCSLESLFKDKPHKALELPFDNRLYTIYLSKEERDKHIIYTKMETREEYLSDILLSLTPDDVRHLIQAEDELTQATGDIERVFPTAHTHAYHEYLAGPRYYNRLFDAWEHKYASCRAAGIQLLRNLCEIGYHLEMPPIPLKRAPAECSLDGSRMTWMRRRQNLQPSLPRCRYLRRRRACRPRPRSSREPLRETPSPGPVPAAADTASDARMDTDQPAASETCKLLSDNLCSQSSGDYLTGTADPDSITTIHKPDESTNAQDCGPRTSHIEPSRPTTDTRTTKGQQQAAQEAIRSALEDATKN